MTIYRPGDVSRRALLGSAAAGAAGLALSACSGGSSGASSTDSTGASKSGARKRGGTFRFGPSDFASAANVDPQSSDSTFGLKTAMFDVLVARDHQWRLHNFLAEEFEPKGNDYSTWTIRVRDGVTFHDGKSLGADDVIYTIRRNIDPKTPGFTSGLMAAIDPKGLTKLDERTVRLKLAFPNSQLRQGFGEVSSAILPVDFDPKKPVGTGPFKYQAFTPGQRWVGTRNENWWRSGQPYLDRLELIGFSDATNARTNAFLSGQIDGMDRVPANLLSQVKSRGDVEVIISETGAFEFTGMRLTQGAMFHDNRVRQAFKLMLDRDQMVRNLYGGLGEVGNDVGAWAKFDPSAGSLTHPTQDLDKAKALLRAAGADDMRVTYRVGAVVPSSEGAAELMMQYAKKIGVQMRIEKVQNLTTFYGKQYYSSQMKNSYDYTQSMYENASYAWLPSGGFNASGLDSPKVKSLYKEALNATGDKYNSIMHELAKYIRDEGPWLVWGRHNIPDAYNKKFTGLQKDASGLGFNGKRWEEISLA